MNRAEIEAARDAGLPRPEMQMLVRNYISFYRQPRWAYFKAYLYHRWDELSFRFVYRVLEPIELRWHDRHCNGDCMEGYDGQGNPVKMCFHIPLSNRQDLKCYDLSMKGRVQLGVIEDVPQELYDKIGDKYDS